MISPSSERKEPEPPLLKRTDDFWMCSSHASVTSKLWRSLSSFRGGSLNSHIPSSPRAVVLAFISEKPRPRVYPNCFAFILNFNPPLWIRGRLDPAEPGQHF